MTTIENYGGILEITGVANWSVDSTGNAVRVQDGQGVTLDFAVQGERNVEIYGEIVSAEGECGPANCYYLDNGGAQTLVRLDFDAGSFFVGDCVHIIAPVTEFGGTTQIDMYNFDWFRFY